MRIISGKYGGRHFTPPSGLKLRPTTDRSRESLFNILSHRFELEGASVLELFAGTGAVGLEFLSRGAATLTAIEKDGRSAAFIGKCLRELGEGHSQALKMTAEKYLAQAGDKFDIIFADPPYEHPGQEGLLQQAKSRLNPGGLLIWEHRSKYTFEHLEGFIEARKYGEATFSFFEE